MCLLEKKFANNVLSLYRILKQICIAPKHCSFTYHEQPKCDVQNQPEDICATARFCWLKFRFIFTVFRRTKARHVGSAPRNKNLPHTQQTRLNRTNSVPPKSQSTNQTNYSLSLDRIGCKFYLRIAAHCLTCKQLLFVVVSFSFCSFQMNPGDSITTI